LNVRNGCLAHMCDRKQTHRSYGLGATPPGNRPHFPLLIALHTVERLD
jgi:hypothetical protein